MDVEADFFKRYYITLFIQIKVYLIPLLSYHS
jgi:hypothetical protein